MKNLRKGNVNIVVIIIIVLIVVAGVYVYQIQSSGYQKIEGVIQKDTPKDWNLSGCGYCFVSNDGKYNCVLMTGKAFGNDLSGTKVARNLDSYIGKNVTLLAKQYSGASTATCPISLDVDRIDMR